MEGAPAWEPIYKNSAQAQNTASPIPNFEGIFMPLSNEVHKFTMACEHLIAGMAMYRPLTGDERLLIKHYCNEVLTKVDQPQTNSAQVEIPLSP